MTSPGQTNEPRPWGDVQPAPGQDSASPSGGSAVGGPQFYPPPGYQPTSAPPHAGFGGPAYNPSQFPPSGDPAAYYPGYVVAPPAPEPKSKALLWIGVGMAVVLLLGIIAGVWLVLRDPGATTPVSLPSATASSGSPTPSPSSVEPTVAKDPVVLHTPDTVAGLELDAASAREAGALSAALVGRLPENATPAAAVYLDPKAPASMVYVIGVSMTSPDPKARIDDGFDNLKAAFGSAAKNIKDVNPGSLGGFARCADAVVSGQKLVICEWADTHSFAVVMMLDRSRSNAERLFAKIRTGVETKI